MIKAAKNAVYEGQIERFELNIIADKRGVLMPFDFSDLPFSPQRSFLIDQVAPGSVRGGHGHLNGAQLLICLRGRIEVSCDNGDVETTIMLEPRKFGLLIGAGVISSQRFLDKNTMLMVFASTAFDQVQYISQANEADRHSLLKKVRQS